MAELVDARDSRPLDASHESSSLSPGTKSKTTFQVVLLFVIIVFRQGRGPAQACRLPVPTTPDKLGLYAYRRTAPPEAS